jgi:hypothetical protein
VPFEWKISREYNETRAKIKADGNIFLYFIESNIQKEPLSQTMDLTEKLYIKNYKY